MFLSFHSTLGQSLLSKTASMQEKGCNLETDLVTFPDCKSQGKFNNPINGINISWCIF